MFMSFYNASFMRGDLPNKPIESHRCYTQRGSLCNQSEQSEHLAQSPGHWHLQIERWLLVSSQVATGVALSQWHGSLAGL